MSDQRDEPDPDADPVVWQEAAHCGSSSGSAVVLLEPVCVSVSVSGQESTTPVGSQIADVEVASQESPAQLLEESSSVVVNPLLSRRAGSAVQVFETSHVSVKWLLAAAVCGMVLQAGYVGGAIVQVVVTSSSLWRQTAFLLFTSAFSIVHVAVVVCKANGLREVTQNHAKVTLHDVAIHFSPRRSEWEVLCGCALLQLTAVFFVATSFFASTVLSSKLFNLCVLGGGALTSVLFFAVSIFLRAKIMNICPPNVAKQRKPYLLVGIVLGAAQMGWTLFFWAPFSAETATTFSMDHFAEMFRCTTALATLAVLSVAVHTAWVYHTVGAVLLQLAACGVDVFSPVTPPYSSQGWYVKYAPAAFEGILALYLVFITNYLHSMRKMHEGNLRRVSAASTAVHEEDGATTAAAEPTDMASVTPKARKVSIMVDNLEGDAEYARLSVSTRGGGGGGEDDTTTEGSKAVPSRNQSEAPSSVVGVLCVACGAATAVPLSEGGVCDACQTQGDVVSGAVAAALACVVVQYPAECPHVQGFVVETFLWAMQTHTVLECTHPVVCERCIRDVPFNQQDAHKATCSVDVFRCPLCDLVLEADLNGEHYEVCTEMPVPCPLNCGKEVVRKHLDTHVTVECINIFSGSCPLNCKETFDTEEVRDHHLMTCAHREVSCPLKCAARPMKQVALKNHIFEVCTKRDKRCGFCGAAIRQHELFSHMESCVERLEKCPKGCGVRLPVSRLSYHINNTCAKGYVCESCGVYVEREKIVEHYAESCATYAARNTDSIRECPLGCQELLDAESGVVLSLMNHFESCAYFGVQCVKQCGCVVPRLDMGTHCEQACALRMVSCRFCCVSSVAKALPGHEATCLFRREPCVLAGCTSMLLPSGFQSHILQRCTYRPIFCSFCLHFIPKHDFVSHYVQCGLTQGKKEFVCPKKCLQIVDFSAPDAQSHLKQCQTEDVCFMGCGETIDYSHENLVQHVHDCRKRFTICARGCGQVLQMDEQQDHNATCGNVLLECPLACGKSVYRQHMREHMPLCSLRPLLCPKQCGSIVNSIDLMDHLSHCSGSLVEGAKCFFGCGFVQSPADPLHYKKCKNGMIVCRLCEEMVPSRDLMQHIIHSCGARAAVCAYGCGFYSKHDGLTSHYLNCDRSPFPCPVGCGKIFPSSQAATSHVQNCPIRFHLCGFCFTSMPLQEYAAHLDVCDGDVAGHCPFACEDTPARRAELLNGTHFESCSNRLVSCAACGDIVPASLLRMHEVRDCLERTVSCDACTLPSLTAATLSEHLMFDCKKDKRTFYVCPLSCNSGAFEDSLPTAVEEHLGKCVNLPKKCNCGEWIFKAGHGKTVRSHQCRDLSQLYSCPYGCGEMIEKNAVASHIALQCKHLLFLCKLKCGMYITREHYSTHALRHCRNRLVQCAQCDTLCKAVDLAHHTEHDCKKRKVVCKLGCGLAVPVASAEGHIAKHCVNRPVSCPICGAEDLPLGFLALHLQYCTKVGSASDATFACPLHCGEKQITLGTWEMHFTQTCKRTPMKCNTGCGKYVERGKLATHLSAECQSRKVLCRHACNQTVIRSNLLSHERTCQHALIECPHYYCSEAVPVSGIRAHVKQCAHRAVPCPEMCGAVLPASEVVAHAEICASLPRAFCEQKCGIKGCSTEGAPVYHTVCPLAKRTCANACVESVLLRDMGMHCDLACTLSPSFCQDCGDPIPVQSDVAAHALVCRERVMCCPTCGEQAIKAALLPLHIAVNCPKRRVHCKFGCSALVPVDDVQHHEVHCDFRPVKCTFCSRLFRAKDGHEDTCELREVFCEHCKLPMKLGDLAHHTPQCAYLPQRCKFCSILLPLKHLHDHEESACASRPNCPDCCVTITPGTLSHHRQKDCLKRPAPCPLCKKLLPLDTLEAHKPECEHAAVSCAVCAQQVKKSDISVHTKTCTRAAVNLHKVTTAGSVRPFLGLDVVDYNVYGASIAALVVKVVPNCAAQHAGIEEGAVILAVSDSAVVSREEFLTHIKHNPPKPFETMSLRVVQKSAVRAVEGRRATPEDQKLVLEGRCAEVQLVVGTLPRMTVEEYFACKHSITLSCLSNVAQAFRDVGHGAFKLSAREVCTTLQRVGLTIPAEAVAALSVANVGFTLLEVLEWLRANGYVAKVELFVANGVA